MGSGKKRDWYAASVALRRAAGRVRSLESFLGAVERELRRMGRIRAGWIWVCPPGGEVFRVRRVWGLAPASRSLQDGVVPRAIAEKAFGGSEFLRRIPEIRRLAPAVRERISGLRPVAVPLRVRGELSGWLTLLAPKDASFTAEEIEGLQPITVLLEGILLEDALREEIEQERRRAEALMEDMQMLTASLSHDLRAPLMSISGYVSLLCAERNAGRLGQDARYYLDRLRANSRRLDQMIQHLLELSRSGTLRGKPARVKTSEIVREVLGDYADRIRASGVRVKVEKTLPDTYGDEVQIRRVFQNLIDNALKAYEPRTPSPRLEIGFLGESRVFFVADNGRGIPRNLREEVFLPFRGTDGTGMGWGIGLAMVKRIVDAHGGRIWFESRSGAGTTFYLRLPLASEAVRRRATGFFRKGARGAACRARNDSSP